MENGITGLIGSSKELKACLQIEKSIDEIREQLKEEFVNRIYDELENIGCELICDSEYRYACKIREFISRNKTITLALDIDVDDSSGVKIVLAYYDEENKIISSEKFKKGNQRINRIIENAIVNILEKPRISTQYIRVEYINYKSSKYDFYHFNENCIELKNPSVLRRDTKRIAKKIMKYIDGINEYLEEELF